MKKLLLFCSAIGILAGLYSNTPISLNTTEEKEIINSFLDDWHKAAATADYNGYFNKIAENGRYIGTDATENWDKKAFATFSKPYFDKGKAWNFKAVQRNIYFSQNGSVAWFDELLDTWMKGCRGSGVLEKENGEWRIKHYVLSMTVPNEVTKEVIPLKAKYEDSIINNLKEKH